MAKPKILVQLDSDPQPSVFDSVVAADSGVDHLFRHGAVTVDNVQSLVYGAMFTRGVDGLKSTAIFIGGSDVSQGEAILARVRKTFFGPMRVAVMMDSNGANTTASAAVLAARKHVTQPDATALVLAATGPVGQRAARLLARSGATVRVASRQLDRAQRVRDELLSRVSSANITAHAVSGDDELHAALDGVQIVISAGAPGVTLMSADARKRAGALKVVIDLNAVPPLGIEGVEAHDRAVDRDGVACYGALGVGGMKMKIHKAAIAQLFQSNDQVLDAEEIYALGQQLSQ